MLQESLRYKCQISLLGQAAQLKLQQTSVLCVGAGGLANAALPYLAAAGVGTITIVDGDVVATENLHRQILYLPTDVGNAKASVIGHYLKRQNPNVSYQIVNEYLSVHNAEKLIAAHSIIMDCSDNYFTRYLVSDYCKLKHIPNVHAAVIGFEGYITTLTLTEHSACYRCLYPEPPKADDIVNCSDAGVLGTVPGLLGLLQATEVIKFATGMTDQQDLLDNYLLKINLEDMTFSKRNIRQSLACILCGKKEKFENLPRYYHYATHTIREITVDEFKQHPTQYFCVDVREKSEYDEFNLGFKNIPFSTFKEHIDSFDSIQHQPILICCARGIRSKLAANMLAEKRLNVLTLKGGLEQYKALA